MVPKHQECHDTKVSEYRGADASERRDAEASKCRVMPKHQKGERRDTGLSEDCGAEHQNCRDTKASESCDAEAPESYGAKISDVS